MKKTPLGTTEITERILVLEPDEALLSAILSALHEIVPDAVVDVARDVDEAHRIATNDPVQLFVLDVDVVSDSNPDFLRDLRAGHPKAATILLQTRGSAPPLESEGIEQAQLLEKPFSDSDFKTVAQDVLRPRQTVASQPRHRILIIDDSLMLLNFVEEILTEANYDVVTAGTAQEGLQAARQQKPDLIMLDYLLPDLPGDEVGRLLSEDQSTAHVPVLFMSGFAADLETAQAKSENVLGILHKPFTSVSLLKTVEENLPRQGGVGPAMQSESTNVLGSEEAVTVTASPMWNEPAPPLSRENEEAQLGFAQPDVPMQSHPSFFEAGSYFAGDTSFFSFSRALRVIAREKLTGTLHSAGRREDVNLHAREGKVILVTTRDAEAYCSEAPVTLVNIDPARVAAARDAQFQTGCPLFVTLTREDLILRDPALQLLQHYGQKLFAQQWSASRVRFAFEQTSELPDYTAEIPAEDDIEHWMLSTLRFAQAQDVADKANYDSTWIPAYTRDGFERVQNLRLTVAEAQFASQFNGARPIAQIARNLRLDLKFAGLTLFRFVALEIVECWPPSVSERAERRGVLKRLGRSIGIGE